MGKPCSTARIEGPDAVLAWRRREIGSQPVAVVSGTFDLFQPGNLYLLRMAIRQGLPVIVVVEPDVVAAAHGRPGHPQNSVETRVEMVSHLRGVAAVTSVMPGQAESFYASLGEFVYVASCAGSSGIERFASRTCMIPPLPGCFTEEILQAMETNCTPLALPAGWDEAAPSRAAADQSSPVKVTVNGCFDILHVGHLRFLAEARAMGDSLTVLMNSDSSVGRYKGPTRPVFPEVFRALALKALVSVDDVVVFSNDNPLEEIRLLRPAIHVKGGSYEPDRVLQERELVESWGGKLVCTPMVDGFSTTNFIKKALGG